MIMPKNRFISLVHKQHLDPSMHLKSILLGLSKNASAPMSTSGSDGHQMTFLEESKNHSLKLKAFLDFLKIPHL